jgi:pyruvate/2-oxoglutarate dehydrogenase complex dihydrolipoamide dehydrogenase (E3) component
MPETEHYKNLVLGSGEAGKNIAWTLAKAGERTAVVERGLIGGSCPNIACMPSKNIIHSAKVASYFNRAKEFGIKVRSFSVDMRGVQIRKTTMVDGLIQLHLSNYQKSGAELILGNGRFIAPRTLEVITNEGETLRLSADRIFLNVGTHATVPNIPGLIDARPMTHVELLDLERIPEHLIVLGGGSVGLELGQAMRRHGSRVTIIEIRSHLLGREDPDVSDAILEWCKDGGIDVLLNTRLLGVSGTSGESLRVKVDRAGKQAQLEGSDILVAVGRTPNTQDLGLRETGIELDDRGYIRVTDRLQTTAANVWALGECAGSPQFTHVAFDDFRVVHSNLNGGDRTTRGRLVPFCIFTDPELARVGLNESEAKKLGIEYRLAIMPVKAILRARTLSEERGFLKMLIDEHSNRILGFTAFCAEGGELMAVVQTVILNGIPFTSLRDAIFTHPTMAEGLNGLLKDVRDISLS